MSTAVTTRFAPSRAAVFGAALAALWAAHDIGDHVVQTDHQAAGKAGSWRAMAGHLGGYHATQLAALVLLRRLDITPSWKRTAAAVAFSTITHGLLDRRWPVVRLLDATGSRAFARPVITVSGKALGDPQDAGSVEASGALPVHGPYLADQALHHGCLLVTAAILTGSGHQH